MQELVLTLVFSTIMFMFMAFPAMKIVEFIKRRWKLPPKIENIFLILFTLLLSLMVGVFLKFA